MLKQLLNIIQGKPDPASTAQINATVKEKVRREMRQIPRYPPFDDGIPLIEIEEIIDSQREMIDKLRSVCGFTPEAFEARIMSVIRNYARHVHLLPASRDEHHKGAGGLFRLGLEVGFTAMQSAGGKIFGGRESAERRKLLQPRWVYATFIAGLCCELQRPITSMTIVGPKGVTWKPFLEPLYDWGLANDVDNYNIHWRGNNYGHSIASFFINNIIPKDCQQYLNEETTEIMEAMTDSITGASRLGDGNLLAEIVKNARQINIEKDINANPSMYGQLQLGGHLEPYTCDAMRELLAKGDWKINGKQARVWYTDEGMFIVWHTAFKDILGLIESRNIRGFPNNPDTLADMLLQTDKSIFEINQNGGAYWEIMLPGTGKLISAVKLVDPKLLLGHNEVEKANIRLMLPDVSHLQEVEAPTEKSSAVEQTVETKPDQKPAEQDQKPAQDEVSMPEQKPAKPRKAESAPVIDPDFYLNQVGEETRMLLSAIRRDYLAKESEHPVWMTAKGLAISSKEFNSHGIPPIKVIEDLRQKNWLVSEGNTSRLLAKLDKDGVKIDAYLINRSIAEAIGFKEPA
jgi:conjugal transfer pilus assembly protein TraI